MISTNLARRAFRVAREQSLWPLRNELQIAAMGKASRAEIDARQSANLRRLLEEARACTPFYRTRLAGYTPASEGGTDIEAFRKLDVLTRVTVRQEHERMKSARIAPRAFRRSATGGSTGTPMPFYTTSSTDLTRTLIRQRMESLVGIQIGDRRLKLWGSEFDVTSAQNLLGKLAAYAINQRILPAFELTECNLHTWLDQIENYQPRVLEAYTDTLVLLARTILRQSRVLDHHMVAVIAAAEGINEVNRQIVHQAFGVPVLSRYGTRELGNVAHECLAGGMHIAEDYYLVEVLDDSGQPCAPGEEGRLVITDLTNLAFPLIRYEVGDNGILASDDESCPCGHPFRRIAQITGRTGDQIMLPDGRRITPCFFPHLIKEIACVEQYKIIQDRCDHIRILVRAERELSESDRLFLSSQLDRYLPGIQCSIERHDILPVSPSGKHRVVESLVETGVAE